MVHRREDRRGLGRRPGTAATGGRALILDRLLLHCPVVRIGGRVVETGSHDQLMAADGLYRRLVSRQLVEA